MSITLNINKQSRAVDVAPGTPLLWVLRDTLGLLGTKFGCGIGQCGACTVHLEGEAVRACQLPVSEIGPRKITTIEGLAASAAGLTPLQQTWCDLDVAQCGYCQAGQIMSAAALLARNGHIVLWVSTQNPAPGRDIVARFPGQRDRAPDAHRRRFRAPPYPRAAD